MGNGALLLLVVLFAFLRLSSCLSVRLALLIKVTLVLK